MKIMTKAIHRTTAKVLIVLLAATLFVLPAAPAYAAGGTATVTLSNVEGLSEDAVFTFDLYKVGHFNGPNLELEEAFQDSHADVQIPSGEDYDPDDYDGATWETAWLNSARTLSVYIDGLDEKPESLGQRTASAAESGNSFSYDLAENGLYLLKGSTVRVGNMNWTPQPMFIMILNGNVNIDFGNSDVAVKMIGTPVVFKHMVRKEWSGDEAYKDRVRPKSIRVNLLYGDTVVDTVMLNADNDWSYHWQSTEVPDNYTYGADRDVYSDEALTKVISDKLNADNDWTTTFTPEEDDLKWSCVELFEAPEGASEAEQTAATMLSKFYLVEYSDPVPAGDVSESFTITNTFSPKKIQITKVLDGYVDAGEDSTVTIAFKIVGKDSSGAEVYTNHAGLTFGRGEDGSPILENTVIIDNVPANVETIEVTEEYTGNYVQDGEAQITYDAISRIWTVTMNNKHDDHHPGSGVINKYKNGAIDSQEFISPIVEAIQTGVNTGDGGDTPAEPTQE